MDRLGPSERRFILHWGEMSSRWGINRSVAQIHALLYLSKEPLNAEQLTERLALARSNVSTSLRELQAWGVVRVVHQLGDRRDYFESVADAWQMFLTILEQRKRREIDPILGMLRQCLNDQEETDQERSCVFHEQVPPRIYRITGQYLGHYRNSLILLVLI